MQNPRLQNVYKNQELQWRPTNVKRHRVIYSRPVDLSHEICSLLSFFLAPLIPLIFFRIHYPIIILPFQAIHWDRNRVVRQIRIIYEYIIYDTLWIILGENLNYRKIWSANWGISALVSTLFFIVRYVSESPTSGPGRSHSQVSRSHNNAPQSVGLLWTTDQLVAETSAWQHTQHPQQTDIHSPDCIRTHNPSKPAAAHIRLGPRGHWNGCCLFGIKQKRTSNSSVSCTNTRKWNWEG